MPADDPTVEQLAPFGHVPQLVPQPLSPHVLVNAPEPQLQILGHVADLPAGNVSVPPQTKRPSEVFQPAF